MDSPDEIRRLRRALRDLVALSTIPAAWVGREPPAVAAGLADVLVGSLHLEFAFVRLCDPNGGPAVEAMRGEAWQGFGDWLRRRLTEEPLPSRAEIVPDLGNGDRSVRGVVMPIGVGGEAGLVVAASDRAAFPDETDHLLLSVAGNHAATAFQNARLVEAHTRSEEALSRVRDQLEQRVAERTLELSRTTTEALATQQRFRDLVNSVEGIVWEADGETFVFSFVSEQAERILGYPVEQWMRKPTFWSDHIHPDDRDGAVRSCQNAAAEKRSRDFEYRMIAADGRVVWFRGLVSVVVEGDGAARLRGVMVDITERKQADEDRQARGWVMESLDRVTRAIQGTNDLEQMMSDVLDAALSIFDCDRAWLVYPCDPDAAWHGAQMQRTRPEFPGLFAVGEQVPMESETADVFRTVRAARGAVQFGPHSAFPLSGRLAKRLGTQSRMLMALYPKGDQPYMFGLSQCSYPRVWTRQEQFLFEGIGRRLEDALTSLSIFHRLRESEKRYRHIFESTAVSIWEEDFSQVKAAIDELRASGVRDLRAYFASHPQFVQDAIKMVSVIDVNMASVKLFAAESKDQLLTSLDKLFVAETNTVFAAELLAVAEGRTFFEAETALQTLRGERLTVLCTIAFPPSSDRFESALVTIVDITARKQAEYLTEQVFEGSPDAVAVIGRDYRYRRVNPVYERNWGLPVDTIVGMHVAQLRGSDAFEGSLKTNLDRCFAGEQVTYGEWLTNAAARVYHVRTYTALRNTSNEVIAALVISRDLTEHMLAVEALQKAQAELAHVTRVTTLGELAASVAHEVNQPLAAIVADANASLNWLAASPPDLESVSGALEAIVRDGHRAGEVIQRIRQLARKGAPRTDPLDLNDVVRDVVPLVRAELLHQEISLTLDLGSKLCPVLGDRIQLQQVLLNLVMNAIEAMGSVADRHRELLIRSESRDDDHISVAVQDTGIGVAAGHLDHLFSAFFTTKPGGMGMGLSISRSIIEAHGGQLWATPNRPHGAIFHFALPAAEPYPTKVG
ncbi:MAG TPA: PAS domain S-box protein [Methylomirabilota bacterium]|nr:PAS domain S-box protein [Methylomirabilota bacterium]